MLSMRGRPFHKLEELRVERAARRRRAGRVISMPPLRSMTPSMRRFKSSRGTASTLPFAPTGESA